MWQQEILLNILSGTWAISAFKTNKKLKFSLIFFLDMVVSSAPMGTQAD